MLVHNFPTAFPLKLLVNRNIHSFRIIKLLQSNETFLIKKGRQLVNEREGEIEGEGASKRSGMTPKGY